MYKIFIASLVVFTMVGAGCAKPAPQKSIRDLEPELKQALLADEDVGGFFTEDKTMDIENLPVTYGDITGDKQDEAIIPINSGGTAGDIYLLVYGVKDGKPLLLNKLQGNHIGGEVKDGKLVVRQAGYEGTSWPTFVITDWYEWNGDKFKVVSSSQERLPEPENEDAYVDGD